MERHDRKLEAGADADHRQAGDQQRRRRRRQRLRETETAGGKFDEADAEQQEGGGHARQDKIFQRRFLGVWAVARIGDHADHRQRHRLQAEEQGDETGAGGKRASTERRDQQQERKFLARLLEFLPVGVADREDECGADQDQRDQAERERAEIEQIRPGSRRVAGEGDADEGDDQSELGGGGRPEMRTVDGNDRQQHGDAEAEDDEGRGGGHDGGGDGSPAVSAGGTRLTSEGAAMSSTGCG
jgi:hypothetical protein